MDEDDNGKFSLERVKELLFDYRVMLLNIPAVIFMVAIACMTGLTVLAYYASIQCDPLESGMVDSPNQVKTPIPPC